MFDKFHQFIKSLGRGGAPAHGTPVLLLSSRHTELLGGPSFRKLTCAGSGDTCAPLASHPAIWGRTVLLRFSPGFKLLEPRGAQEPGGAWLAARACGGRGSGSSSELSSARLWCRGPTAPPVTLFPLLAPIWGVDPSFFNQLLLRLI